VVNGRESASRSNERIPLHGEASKEKLQGISFVMGETSSVNFKAQRQNSINERECFFRVRSRFGTLRLVE